MRISKEQLQKIIAEEVRAHVKKKLVTESVSEPRTVKATPAMLKSIIAEEAAKVNEADPGRPIDGSHDPIPHPDNEKPDRRRGGKYSDESYEALQDEFAKDAARREVELKNRKYAMNTNFFQGYRGGVLINQKTGETLCELRFAGNSPCAKEIIDFAFGNINRLYTPEYVSDIVNILKAHDTVDADATPEDFLLGLGSYKK